VNAIDSTNSVRLKTSEAEPTDVGRGIARIDHDDMAKLNVRVGDYILVQGQGCAIAKVMPAFKDQRGTETIQMDGLLRYTAKCPLDDWVNVTPCEVHQATAITLRSLGAKPAVRDSSYIQALLEGTPAVAGSRVRATLFGNDILDFEVIQSEPKGPIVIAPDTAVSFEGNERPQEPYRPSYEDIGGIRTQMRRIREMIELPLKFPEVFDSLGVAPPRGILLYGPPGCGKTLIARTIAHETEANFFTISGPEVIHKFYGESEAHLRKIFEEAGRKGPSIIFLDEIDAIAPHRENAAGDVERRVVAQLLTLMDGLNRRENVIVIAATNLPNAIDPALRRPGRFDREIEIPIPDKHDRRHILSIHTRGIPLTGDVDLDRLAEITHGFVGADVESLCREAAMVCIRRVIDTIDFSQKRIPYDQLSKLCVSMDDFLVGFQAVTPSAIREVFVEVPNVKWSDVGGLETIKQRLRETVVWPLKYENSFAEAGVKPAKGLLLAGPPGVGKTMLAKALATESGVNFIAVKGPELISKFVGESEKGIRSIFTKAKQAAPCIIFFDEIDGLLPARNSGTNDSGVASRVLSQFLTEMDGVEELRGVFVLGATNRPDMMDPALRRFGRFETTIQLGLPDRQSRESIIKVHAKSKPLSDDCDLDWLADASDGMSGADLAAILSQASRQAMRRRIVAMEEGSSTIPEMKIGSQDLRDSYREIKSGNDEQD
jgi:transitional endoplasmic reticulum ATPase